MPGPRLTLAIETSNPSAQGPGHAGLALRVGDGVHVEPVGAAREDDLMPAIDRLFGRVGRRPSDLGLIAVSLGPGGFTALRVCVTVAKAVALATRAQCIGVPTAHALASAARRNLITGTVGVLLASKGDSAFAAVFVEGSEEPADARLVEATDLAALGVHALIADQFLPATMRAEAERLGLAVHPPHFDASIVLALGESLAARMGPTPIDALAPIYPREPEAVTKWRLLHPGEPG